MHYSLHDSDMLIVQTAIASARNKSTVVIEEDTIMHYVEMEADDLFLSPEPQSSHEFELGT